MAVDRCLCRKVRFVDALAVARGIGARTVGQLQRHLDLGTGCGLCIPYMQRSLMTGETDLPLLDAAESARLVERAGIRLLGEAE